jgi:hypothetical protein
MRDRLNFFINSMSIIQKDRFIHHSLCGNRRFCQEVGEKK